jgi:hypothetical protein
MLAAVYAPVDDPVRTEHDAGVGGRKRYAGQESNAGWGCAGELQGATTPTRVPRVHKDVLVRSGGRG